MSLAAPASVEGIDPDDLRRDLLAHVGDILNADTGVYQDLVFDLDSGLVLFGHSVSVGFPEFQDFVQSMQGQPYERSGMDVASAPNVNRWTLAAGPHMVSPAARQEMWTPTDINSAIGLNVVEHARLVGQVCWQRHGDSAPFTEADLARCMSYLDYVLRTVILASNLSECTRACTLLMRPSGELMARHGHYTGDVDLLVERVGECVDALEAAPESTGEAELFLHRDHVRVTRMTCPKGGLVAYLIAIRPMVGARVPEVAMLSHAKRQIAGYAAVGATIDEIAQTLGRSPHTVRGHLKEIYAALGIGSRAELAALVEGVYHRA